MKLTWNGPSVPARMAAIVAVIAGAGSRPTPSEPSAPALLTATARSGVIPTKAMPAWAIGVDSPKASVKRVRSLIRSPCRIPVATVSRCAQPGLHTAQTSGTGQGGGRGTDLVHVGHRGGRPVRLLARGDLRGLPGAEPGIRPARRLHRPGHPVAAGPARPGPDRLAAAAGAADRARHRPGAPARLLRQPAGPGVEPAGAARTRDRAAARRPRGGGHRG